MIKVLELFPWEGLNGALVKISLAMFLCIGVSYLLRGLAPRWTVMITRVGFVAIPLILISNYWAADWHLTLESLQEALASDGGTDAASHIPSQAFAVEQSGGYALDWKLVLLVGWVLGFVLSVGKEVMGLFTVAIEGFRACPASNTLQKRWQAIASEMGVESATIRVMEDDQSPFITYSSGGVVVVVPPSFECEKPEEVTRATHALRHEAAHVKSLDHIWVPMMRMGVCLVWFHPFAWWLTGLHIRSCEEACDAAAARVGGVESYRKALAQLALDLVPVNQAVATSLIRLPSVVKRVKRIGLTAVILPPRFSTMLPFLSLIVLSFFFLGSFKGIAYSPLPLAEGSSDNTVQGEVVADSPEASKPDITIKSVRSQAMFKVRIPPSQLAQLSDEERKQLEMQLSRQLQGTDIKDLNSIKQKLEKQTRKYFEDHPERLQGSSSQ